MQKGDLVRALSGLPIPDIRFFETIGSTNDEGMAWAEAGAADGSLVVAEQQTKGRGRLGRSWVTNPDAALAFTLILRPTQAEMEHIGLFSPLAGLAVCLVLQGMGLPAEIKWPNDVLLARQKTCGILAESTWHGGQLQGVVVGVGINVAPSSIPPAEQLQFPATCVEDALGQPVDRAALLRDILAEFFAWREKLAAPEFFQAWEERLAFKGEVVELKNTENETVTGVLTGVDEQGNLRIHLTGGGVKLVSAGDVGLRPKKNFEGSGR